MLSARAGAVAVATSLLLVSPAGRAQGQPKGRSCVDNGPCITDIREDYDDQNKAFLVVTWDGHGTWDHYNIKYSRPGKESPPYRMEGNTNHARLPDVLPNITYTFNVQACAVNLQELAQGVPLEECGGWAEASKTTNIPFGNDNLVVPAEQ